MKWGFILQDLSILVLISARNYVVFQLFEGELSFEPGIKLLNFASPVQMIGCYWKCNNGTYKTSSFDRLTISDSRCGCLYHLEHWVLVLKPIHFSILSRLFPVGWIFFIVLHYSGESMENALRACCKGIKIGKILIHRDGDNGKQVSYLEYMKLT